MSNFKKLTFTSHFQKNSDDEYSHLRKLNYYRAKKGLYSRNVGVFDFIKFLNNWPNYVGGPHSPLGLNTVPLKLYQNALVIMTRHQVFSTELSYMTPHLIAKLQKDYPMLFRNLTRLKFINNDQFFNYTKEKAIEEPESKLHPYSPEYINLKNKALELFSDAEDEEIKKLFIDIYMNR